jgi:hypothetical protein
MAAGDHLFPFSRPLIRKPRMSGAPGRIDFTASELRGSSEAAMPQRHVPYVIGSPRLGVNQNPSGPFSQTEQRRTPSASSDNKLGEASGWLNGPVYAHSAGCQRESDAERQYFSPCHIGETKWVAVR